MEFRVLSYIVTFCELDIRKIKSFVLSLYLTYLIKLFMDTGDNELIKCIKEGDLKAFEESL